MKKPINTQSKLSLNTKTIKTALINTLLLFFFAITHSFAEDYTPQQSSKAQAERQLKNEALLVSYLSAWDEVDATKRLAIIKTFFTDTSVYHDPASYAIGSEQLNDMISAIRQQFPLLKSTHEKIYSTGDYFTFTWKILGAKDKLLFAGSDTMKLSKEGKIIEIIGFF